MKVTVAVDLDKTSKQDYVNELKTDGSGDVSRPLTVTTDNTPEVIEVDVDTEEEFLQILTSDKVAGAQSDRLELKLTTNGTRSLNPNTTSSVDISHHNWGLAAGTQSSTTYANNYTYNNLGDGVDCVAMDTGIVVGHPEFNDVASNSTTRINQINWVVHKVEVFILTHQDTELMLWESWQAELVDGPAMLKYIHLLQT